ncbi:hypothetical protein BpHYR1_045677 [Brachionus plicatilis]|uniref:Uncharacterized protein n=1 Tax=Brachionus plicatilis TaxID=10195 RepID=A0A3M7QH71_BRAPC|nr:hypothetical protein BpHYR1_045677 [Brachionus plicatilis]
MNKEELEENASNVKEATQIIRNLIPQISSVGEVAQNFSHVHNQLLEEIRGMRNDFNRHFDLIDSHFDFMDILNKSKTWRFKFMIVLNNLKNMRQEEQSIHLAFAVS